MSNAKALFKQLLSHGFENIVLLIQIIFWPNSFYTQAFHKFPNEVSNCCGFLAGDILPNPASNLIKCSVLLNEKFEHRKIQAILFFINL